MQKNKAIVESTDNKATDEKHASMFS